MKTFSIFRIHIWLLLLFISMVLSCSPSTQITGSWKYPEPQSKSYKKLVIVAMTDNIGAKRSVEQNLKDHLSSPGIAIDKSIDLFPPDFSNSTNDKDLILDKVRENGNDAIMTVTLLDEKTESRYVPGTFNYAPMGFGYYGTFGGYYNFMNPRMFNGGYYTEDKTYFIETNIYEVESEKLIWSAQSETYNPVDLATFSKNFAKSISDRIKKEGLFGNTK